MVNQFSKGKWRRRKNIYSGLTETKKLLLYCGQRESKLMVSLFYQKRRLDKSTELKMK